MKIIIWVIHQSFTTTLFNTDPCFDLIMSQVEQNLFALILNIQDSN